MREVFEKSVNLDYWNIRHWRALYLRFEELNAIQLTSLRFLPSVDVSLFGRHLPLKKTAVVKYKKLLSESITNAPF